MSNKQNDIFNEAVEESRDITAVTVLLADWIREYMGTGKGSLKVILHDDEGDWSPVYSFANDLATIIVNRAMAIADSPEYKVSQLAKLIQLVNDNKKN